MAIVPFNVTELFIKIQCLHQKLCDIPAQDIAVNCFFFNRVLLP